VLNSHCLIPFGGVKIFAFIVPEQLSSLWNGDSVSSGKALGQFIGQTTCHHAESSGIIKKTHKSCVVTNAATIWIFQNINRSSNVARKAASQSCSVEVDIPLCHIRSVDHYLSLDAMSYVYRMIWWNVGQKSFVSVSRRLVTRQHKSKHSNKSVNNNNNNNNNIFTKF
jgi:RecJ-like exonuclease